MRRAQARERGFTITELLIVVGILAVVSAVAVSYVRWGARDSETWANAIGRTLSAARARGERPAVVPRHAGRFGVHRVDDHHRVHAAGRPAHRQRLHREHRLDPGSVAHPDGPARGDDVEGVADVGGA